MDHGELETWISRSWDESIRENPEDRDGRLGVPRPYVVPCVSETFQELFYWDTVFAGIGLILSGRVDAAKDCCDDLLALVRRIGFVPNAAREGMLDRSQPPLLGFFVETVAAAADLPEYPLAALDALDAEYRFWMERRCLPCGLNRYGHDAGDDVLDRFCRGVSPRVGCEVPGERSGRVALGAHLLAEAESGWDFTARFRRRAMDFAPVDLNAILYGNECRYARWHAAAGNRREADRYAAAAADRLSRMRQWCFDGETKCFCDYDAAAGRRSEFFSAASFFALWFGCMADRGEAEAAAEAMKRKLLTPYGIMATEMLPDGAKRCQWDAPSLWPPLQMAAILGLRRYGMRAAARELAERFSRVMLENFGRTGKLWEKYDGTDGGVCTRNAEYGTPPMLGWSAGCFMLCRAAAEERPALAPVSPAVG